MAELSDVRMHKYLRDELTDEDFANEGDSGFGGWGNAAAFNPVGQGGIFGSVLKIGKGLFGKAKKLISGGSSKVATAAKAAKKAAASPTGQRVIAAGGAALGAGGAVTTLLPSPRGQNSGGSMMAGGGGGGARGPSIIVDGAGVAWRRAGRPVLWSGDLTAVKRVNKAASRARRASGSRRSVQRRRG